MEGEEEGGPRLSKRFSDKGGEVDYKTKAGTAWSHSYLNQKPWHPLSYPNQRRKWIAEQTHAQRQRRDEEVAREYSQEQEFFRQTALISKKEKEKVELMQAVSFMYVRPPGYNAESAKAAEIAGERRKEEQDNPPHDQGTSSPNGAPEQLHGKEQSGGEKKKPRPKDVFGRAVPTEEEFEILKNAPRLETGVAGRAKPFGVEVRNVKCLRCGTFGHQSGDRECPLKDAIMPNEQNRLMRDDPLNAIIAHTDPSEPLKWELKQRPGISPPRGGFNPDDPNQQIVADDIFDEYGGFLAGDNVPELLATFSFKPSKKKLKKKKHKKRHHQSSDEDRTSAEEYEERKSKKKRVKKKKGYQSDSSLLETSESDGIRKKCRQKYSHSSDDSDRFRHKESKKHRQRDSYSYEDYEYGRHNRNKCSRHKHSHSSEGSEPKGHRSVRSKHKRSHSYKGYVSDTQNRRRSNQTADADSDRHHISVEYRHKQSHSRVSEKSVPKRHHSSGHHHHSVHRHEHSGSE